MQRTNREIAYVEYRCKSEIVTAAEFDVVKFFAALDSARELKKLSWKKVADEAKVSASTLTRISQGRRPDIDSFGALCGWAGLQGNDFFSGAETPVEAEPLTKLSTYLRADPNLSPDGAKALEAIIRAAYDGLKGKSINQ